MTMPFERTRALRWAGEFLREIRSRSDVPADLKRQVLSILRHYPEPRDIKSQARLDELRKDPLGAWLEPEPTTEVNSEDLAAEAITRIIFIDLDGVLHATSGPGSVMQEYVWLPELLDLVAGHANVGLVVHGSARQRSSEEFLRERMALSVPRWCGTTDPRLERWPSIQAWLQQHPEVRDFLVLDDQPGEFPTPAPAQLIVCDGRTGLSESAVQNKVSSWLARTRLADLAVGYSEGAVSWLQVSRETGLSFGELLVELARQRLKLPQVTAEKTPAQAAFFDQVLTDAAKSVTTGDTLSFRKLSPGLTRAKLSFSPKLRGYRLASGDGPLRVQFPPSLIRLLGWRVGMRMMASSSKRGVSIRVSRVPSALHAMAPWKWKAADKVLFQRRWQHELQALRRCPQMRRWGSISELRT